MQLDNLHQSVRETLAGQSVVLPETLGEAEQVALREWQQQVTAVGDIVRTNPPTESRYWHVEQHGDKE
jgi:hypothetical protein